MSTATIIAVWLLAALVAARIARTERSKRRLP